MHSNLKRDLVIQKLERGNESLNEMMKIFQKLVESSSLDQAHLKWVDDHRKVVQTSFHDALDFIQQLGPTDIINHFSKIQHNSKDRRGCYKRRRNEEARVIETMNLSDDGHAWRKYGQKAILNSAHPRNYYRCTHKHEEGCEATKQVQQVSEYPLKYRIIYHGQHTCKAANTGNSNNPTILLDSIGDENHNSSILLSFDTAKQPLNYYPFTMFPPSTPSSSSSSAVALLTGSSIKEEANASEPLNSLDDHQYAGTPSPDVTALSGVISSTELYSPVSSVHVMDTDQCYSNILADDLINLGDLYNQHNPAW